MTPLMRSVPLWRVSQTLRRSQVYSGRCSGNSTISWRNSARAASTGVRLALLKARATPGRAGQASLGKSIRISWPGFFSEIRPRVREGVPPCA